MMKQVEVSGKMSEDKEDILLLFTDPHPFKSDMYLSVTDKVPNAKNVELSGTFLTKVFDGPYKAIPKFMKQMDSYLRSMNKKADTYYAHYAHYAYCPTCAEEKGHNNMVLFAKIED